ncbi:hypothetical protein D3C73_792130 [compost metagenome]
MQVEHKALGRLRRLPGQVGFLQAAVAQRRAVIADGVAGGGELAVVVIGAPAQDLAGDVSVAEVLDAEVVEIVQATADRQVLAPPVGVAFEGNAAPGVNLAHAVRAAAQRGFVAAAVGEVAGFPPVLGKHRQGGDVQGQGAVFVALEVKAYLER